MIDLNFPGIVVAAVVVFVLSSVYYIALGGRLASLHEAYVDSARPPAWKLAAELVRNVVLAVVVAALVDLLGIADLAGGAALALGLWIGFPAVLLSGSVIHENVPPQLAAIHAGDWLIKLFVITLILALWP